MCLKTDWEEPIIANKNITCWKVIYKSKINKSLMGYYQQSYVYSKNEILKEEDFDIKPNRNIVIKGFHSFVSFWGALKFYLFQYNEYSILWKMKLVKCIIPKGSFYYKGYFDDDKSYVSNQIIIK